MELTHASFFSGVGGLDLGLERAGWRTVSFSEIDPYASAVLAERWPGVPNLGDITDLDGAKEGGGSGQDPPAVAAAILWSGGFPCQDLSVAGKRAGMGTHHDRADTRSGLAYAFLDLVGRHRPPAVLLENVPGLLSSHAGRDLGALLGRLGHLGYGWAYRILDAQWFGVPQRRRRVFILALDLGLDPPGFGPAEVLAVGTRCGRNHAAEREAWAQVAGRVGRGAGIVGALDTQFSHHGGADTAQSAFAGHYVPAIVEQAISSKWAKRSSGPAGDEHHHLICGAPSDPDGVRAPDGLAGRLDGGEVVAFVKGKRAQTTENAWDVGDTRATVLMTQALDAKGGGVDDNEAQAGLVIGGGLLPGPDGLLPDPDGLDSNRYRTVGNGVVAPVAEWIGRRLADYFGGAL